MVDAFRSNASKAASSVLVRTPFIGICYLKLLFVTGCGVSLSAHE